VQLNPPRDSGVESSLAHPHLRDGELLAAIDLGSNSFHMVVARYVLGQLRIVDKLREMVRLGEGLDGRGGLSGPPLQRALDCLQRFGQRVATLPPNRVRAIATNTVRQLRNPQIFLLPAETALGHGIEVVAGREEARLIHLGVAFGQPPSQRRLVIDIGGGSTEFIIGDGFDPLERESLQMGCIATTRRFFGDGRVTGKRWRDALTEVSAEFQQFAAAYRALGWKECLGSSGTIKSIGHVAKAMKLGRGDIGADALRGIRTAVIDTGDLSRLKLPGLNEERRDSFAGGLLVLEAAFNELQLDVMQVSETAMREGILFDMIGRAQQRDPRDASVAALAQRYGADREQAARVEASAMVLFDQVAANWGLAEEDRRMLAWAARIHEIGLAIAHSQYHVHGAYVIENSDIAGFSNQEQQALAALLRCQRRTPAVGKIEALPERLATPARRLMLLLRLAVLLHRGHDPQQPPPVEFSATGNRLLLSLPAAWLANHPLTRADLEVERELLSEIGYRLTVATCEADATAP
jgi:exopolyphosphatase / guanosine-5'-triphosphate,3'-diphosphate pyrophosphatase